VDDEGMVKGNNDLRVLFTYMVQKIAKHGKLPLTINRAGKEMHVEVPVQSKRATVIPPLEGAYPSYFVYGPMVFSSATLEFVSSFSTANRQWLTGAGSWLISRLGDKPAFPGEGLAVVSSPFFPNKLAEGYASPLGEVVKTVNGIRIKNLKQLVEVLRDSKDEFIRFEFDQHQAESLVFPRKAMMAATDDILNDNGVRSQGSPDTMEVWNQAKTKR
jgi:hypothetical protein